MGSVNHSDPLPLDLLPGYDMIDIYYSEKNNITINSALSPMSNIFDLKHDSFIVIDLIFFMSSC